MKAFLLVDAVPDGVAEVGAWLKERPEVRALHVVHYGHFSYLAELEARDHISVQLFIANKVRYLKGVEQVREVDEDQLPAILASEERRHPLTKGTWSDRTS